MSRIERPLTCAARTGGLALVLLLAGCAWLARAPESEPTQSAAAQAAPPAQKPAVTPAAPAPEPPTQGAAQKPVEPTKPTPQAASKSPPPPAAKPSAKAPAVAKKETQGPSPGAVKPSGPPPLDLKSLETRLKETKAIGVLTKITIKNQVDELLDQFRAFYQGRLKTSLAELRQPYDRLVLKIVALLQDGDPPLARDIVASREQIWGVLADPVKFANH